MSESAVQPTPQTNQMKMTPEMDVEQQTASTAQPSTEGMARVIIHNDDVTPYEYVIDILGGVFMLSEEIADHIAWTAHTKGQAVVVVRPRAEAEKLAKIAQGRAKRDGFPLTFSLETES
ncbi:ATP-dependent Clp protease adaptor ClpS [Litorilinea aerophila]|nr:ATP-dependent Clp protease adaptor ClpS [Litorilinea aerophila]MCC9077380.1 ATP-dependent Clp protease adaptor ClpS [Litorilinea aerophila]GIV76254.1 MAG: hypothetical protein KatS3mg050_0648 [Litorilinea sp.]